MDSAECSAANFFLNLISIVALFNFTVLCFELCFAHTFLDFLLLKTIVIDCAGCFLVLEHLVGDMFLMKVALIRWLGCESTVDCLVFVCDRFDPGRFLVFYVGWLILIEYFFVIGQGGSNWGDIFFEVIQVVSPDSTNRRFLFALFGELPNL